MISINLKGGLGNQLFQISCVYSLAMDNNDIPVFNFDKCYTPLQGHQIKKYRNTIFKNFKHIDNFVAENFYQEYSYYYKQIEYKPNLLLDGYFQSEKYFSKYKSSLIDIFCFDEYKEKSLNFLNNINTTTTSLHVRRGDYIPYQSVMYLLDDDYYNPAINKFKDTTFIVFSDDLQWVKQKFNKPNMVVFDSDDEVLNMTCMSLCNNNIIANSTFSWWGAYLNKNKNKTVIAPRKWYSTPELIENKDKIPNDWIII
jgi:hypothetical protein